MASRLHRDGLDTCEGSPFASFWSAPARAENAYRAYAEELSWGCDSFRPLTPASPTRWQHNRDKEAIRKMRSLTGFDKVLRVFSSYHVERIERICSQTTRIQVTPQQVPRL